MLRTLILSTLLALPVACDGADDGATSGGTVTDTSGADTTVAPCSSDAECDDSNPCTVNVCGVGGACAATALTGKLCDDGDACTAGETCDGGGACVAGSTIEVTGGQCETCACDPSTGVQCAAAPDGIACVYNDNLCTQGDQCTGGVCQPGPPASLDDLNPCTRDVCIKGVVEHQPLLEGQCDDGDECTTGDRCSIGTCVGGDRLECELPVCASSVSCVTGAGCVPVWSPPGAACVGSDPCGSGWACDADHACSATASADCDDDDLCTVDTCDGTTGECVNSAASIDCSAPASDCLQAACNPATGACDLPVADGAPCDGGAGACDGGVCACAPSCDDAECGSNGCGGSCGDCDDDEVCQGGQCLGSCASCATVCLPDGTCCPGEGFCPTADTTLSGSHAFALVYIPAGVTVDCAGGAPLALTVLGDVIIEGALRADGADGTSGSGSDSVGACGGYSGGDGFRACTSGATTFCETSAASVGLCQGLISPKESYSGAACTYLANAPGEPGYGPGGGYGGQMGVPLNNEATGSAAGGGGASFIGAGSAGQAGSLVCGPTPQGGARGPTYGYTGSGTPPGGSGGGGGGLARSGTCGGATCWNGCTGWGGDGGAGGGVITIEAGGAVEIDGIISARGGPGGTSGGAGCAGSGGGGSGGSIVIDASALNTTGAVTDHLDVSGGLGGPPDCPGLGTGGDGGAGLLLLP